MQLENIQHDIKQGEQVKFRQPLHDNHEYGETKYRWVILVLASMMMVLNGLLNNIIIPLESKLASIYGLNSKVVNIATILSFLAFLMSNLPANYILDQKGIKFGFIVGNSIYLCGIVLSCCINAGFPFVIIGYLLFVMGQPFIMNIPAKIATYWFFPENRALATSIMVGSSIIGSGVGFAIPTLVVKEGSSGDYAKRQIFSLYLGYAIATFVMLIINVILMKSKPVIPPSKIDKKESLTIKQTFQSIKGDRNLWKFFGSYSIFYGTFLIFGASSNFLIKPFGYSDLMISLAAVGLILMGTVGAIIGSIFIKKTRKYKMMITVTTFASMGILALMTFQLLIVPVDFLTLIIVCFVGFFVVPVVPASYQIGCELAFPIGQAQVTGILNGGALFWAFIMDSILTAAIGFGTPKKTIIFMFILILFLLTGAILYFKTKIILKRKEFEESIQSANSSPEVSRESSSIQQPKELSLITTPFEDNASTAPGNSYKPSNYLDLVQQRSQ